MIKVKQIIIAVILLVSYSLTAQIAINNDGSSADPSAILDVKSSDKGMLIPRLTQSEIEAITDQANGLIVFNTDDKRYYFYDDIAFEWKEMAIGAGTITPGGSVGEVNNPVTVEIWMDRNLGASQIATSSTDADAYGDLYQWGRAAEGHESRTSGTTSINATAPIPNGGNSWDGKFITESSSPYDWLSTADITLWQGAGGTNNPCPSGFRLPTEAEWISEMASWTSQDAAGAYGSPLNLTVGGHRYFTNGSLNEVGNFGTYWASTTNGPSGGSSYLIFGNSVAATAYSGLRAFGYSVRCIKD